MRLTFRKGLVACLAVVCLGAGSLPRAPAADADKVQLIITNDLKERAEIFVKYVTAGGKVNSLKETVAVNAGDQAVLALPPDVATVKDGNAVKYLVAIEAIRKPGSDPSGWWWGVKSEFKPGGIGKVVVDPNEFVGLTFQAADTKDPGGKTVKNLMITLKPSK